MVLRTGNVWNFVLVLGAIYEDKVYPCGCANLIAPNIALTATHIFSEHFDRIASVDQNAKFVKEYSVIACQIVNGRDDSLQYGVKKIVRYPSLKDNEPIDIAVLDLAPIGEDDQSIKHWRNKRALIDINPPPIGSKISAYGYVDSNVEGADIKGNLEWRHKTRVGKGEVLNIHFPCRDMSGMPFPCFETSARFDPGMSGGPVINANGHLCGIVSRGSDSSGKDDISWASSLWPAMGMTFNGVTLYELALKKTILVKGLEQIRIRPTENNEIYDVEFVPR